MKTDTASTFSTGSLENYNETDQDVADVKYEISHTVNICEYCGKRHKGTYCVRDSNRIFPHVYDGEFYQTKDCTSGKTQQHHARRTKKQFFRTFRIFNSIKVERKTRGLLSLLQNANFTRRKYTVHGLPRWISFFIFFILMTSSLSTADYYSDYVSVMMRSYNKSACDGEYLRIDCPEATTIHIESAMYGRKVPSIELCPSKESLEIGSGSDMEEDTNCEAVTSFEKTGSECQDKRICQLVVHRRVFGKDPCPGTSKYLTVQYKCTPRDFRQQSTCAEQNIRLRCRQGTVISVFKIQLSNKSSCSVKKPYAECTMMKREVMEDLTKKCHTKEKCSYSLPPASCFNHAEIVHTCVPKQFLTSELPTSVELLSTTTSLPATTNYYTTDHSTVNPTVTSLPEEKGDFTTSSKSTSSIYEEDATFANSLNTIAENRTDLSDIQVVTSAVKNSSAVVPGKSNDDVDDIIIRNDFPMLPDEDMMMNSTDCPGCSSNNLPSSGGIYDTWLNLYQYFKGNSDSIIIALLLGVVAALLLTICVLVFPCKKASSTKKKKEQDPKLPSENNRQNSTEVYTVAEAPVQEDEHENMSLLGSLLQRSISSANNTVQRQHITPNTSNIMSGSKIDRKEDRNICGPKSIFAKICCTCCCNNAPWQRTRILKRHRGDVYRVTHRHPSSSEDEDVTERFRSRDSFPVFSRTGDNVDNRSPIPVLEDHVNRTEYPIVMSDAVTSQSQQQNSNFRPISRNANRQYSLTPEPDMTRRTNQSFRPSVRHESQRSDPALNVYSVQQIHNATQPQTAPTSPIIKHHGNFPLLNGTHDLVQPRNRMVSTPKSPKMVTSVSQNSQMHNSVYGVAAAPPQTPMTAQYTPPPSHVYDTQQFPFTNAYEQYDNNAQQPVVRRKQFQRPREYTTHNQYPQQYGTHNGQYSGYYAQNTYGDHFVQAVPRRTIAANALTIDLAANARTVDLSHNNSLSRNSWLEIRRNSIYDNSLPRNSEMYEFYQKELLAMQQQHHPQHDLPGTRNLNQYY